MFQYIAAGAGTIALIFGGIVVFQHNTIEGLELDVAAFKDQVSDKDATIEAQRAGIADIIKAATAAEAALKAAGDTIDAQQTQLAAERARRNATVEKDYVLPDCKALLDTDLGAVCPAHAQRLRDAAGLPRP